MGIVKLQFNNDEPFFEIGGLEEGDEFQLRLINEKDSEGNLPEIEFSDGKNTFKIFIEDENGR